MSISKGSGSGVWGSSVSSGVCSCAGVVSCVSEEAAGAGFRLTEEKEVVCVVCVAAAGVCVSSISFISPAPSSAATFPALIACVTGIIASINSTASKTISIFIFLCVLFFNFCSSYRIEGFDKYFLNQII
ncbi:hypothetical protein SDC9_202425 [bioreactor metagenome]|uniref:Uncharacterized protein n=1 Tax=bioreactor metagenome TaxID=1076179 RepID=A0A645ITL8_9ZZZZ